MESGQFLSRITVKKRVQYIGAFSSEVDAAKAFDARARELGRLGALNFPADGDDERMGDAR